MVFVVLRIGKVLQYNAGEATTVEDGTLTVRGAKQKGCDSRWLVARIPLDIVERAEFEPPCAIRRARSHRKQTEY